MQAIIDSKRNGQGPRRQRNFENILQGVLYCACNEKMTSATGQSRTGTVYRYYRCYGQMKGPATDCEHPRVPAGEVEQVIIDKIREVCADPAVRGEVAKRLQWGKEQSGRAIALERDVIQKKIDELSKEAQSLLTFVRESGGKAGSTVSDQLAKVELALDEERLKANELDDRLRGLSTAVGRVQSALDLLSNFSEVWEVHRRAAAATRHLPRARRSGDRPMSKVESSARATAGKPPAEPSAKRACARHTRPVSPGSWPWPTTSKPGSKPASSATTPTWPEPTASPAPGGHR